MLVRQDQAMTLNRSAKRKIHIYNANNPTELGGLRLANGVTNTNFFSMLEILLLLKGIFDLQNEDGVTIVRSPPAMELLRSRHVRVVQF